MKMRSAANTISLNKTTLSFTHGNTNAPTADTESQPATVRMTKILISTSSLLNVVLIANARASNRPNLTNQPEPKQISEREKPEHVS